MNTQQPIIEAIQNGDLHALHHAIEDLLVSADANEQYEMADYLMNFGYLKQADEIYAHLVYLFPEEAQLKIDRATVLMELEAEDEALEMLMDVKEDAPEYPQALLALADYYQMQGLYEVAERHIDYAMELLPAEPLLLFAKAELMMEMGRLSEAARLYEEVYATDKEIAGVRIIERLADVHRQGGSYEEALHYYQHALKDTTSADLLFGAAYASFQAEQYEQAIRYLEDLKVFDPDYFAGYLLLAQSYAMQENNKKALEVIKEGITRDEYDKELYLFAGKMAIKNSLPEEAEAFLRQAIALDPEYMEAVLTLVSMLSNDERDEELIEIVEGLHTIDFEWSTLSTFAAAAYDRLEDYEKASKHYANAYQDHDDDALFLEKYVYFLLEDGQHDKAKEVAKKLNALQPEEQEWLDLLTRFDEQ